MTGIYKKMTNIFPDGQISDEVLKGKKDKKRKKG